MRINNKQLLFSIAIFINSISCETKKVINTTKYENLVVEKRQEVDEYLQDAKKSVIKKENEIALMFQYNCFFGKNIVINNIYTQDFPKSPNKIHYGQKIINYPKSFGKIKVELSNGKHFSIPQKKGYDYITICYNEEREILYTHYYNFPKMLVEE